MRYFFSVILFTSFLFGAWGAADFSADNLNDLDTRNYGIEIDFPSPTADIETPVDTQTPESNEPDCPATVFAQALAATSDDVVAADDEYFVQTWIYQTFQNPDVIKQVLACPDIAMMADDETIQFQPIEYIFADGNRRITINYATQPKILKQRLTVAHKRSLPETNPSPKIGAPGDAAVWTNTEPAWYGILVVQKNSLDEFVGPDKNNTISLKYIEQNIDKLFPQGNRCTSKSALANDNDNVNVAVHKTVDVKDDSNDYYVAGDVNLQWITWAEVALDVAITVVTVGGGTAVLGATKGVRASKAAKGLIGTMKTLERADGVQDYIRLTRQSARAAEELKTINRTTDAARYAAKSEEIAQLGRDIRNLEQIDNVRQYKAATSSFENIMKYRRALRAMKIPQRGNVIARGWRALRAANTGNKMLNKGAKIARASAKSGRKLDYLFHSTMRNIGSLAKVERAGGMIYGTMKFVGDMYDWTETSTGEFTNGIEFKPLGLLSADDLAGQENVINHGMWLMWAGDSLSPADDDAAYLQAMDFAAKFYQDLEEVQEDAGHFCNVDIYVVRPILRNPGTDETQLYYLIMNDQPWSTSEQI